MKKKNVNPSLISKLVKNARDARKRSIAPYSGVRVGAALLSGKGKIYKGCNIESVTFSPSICAERTVIFKALSEGERRFTHIAVVAFKNKFITPCGVCRQVLHEYCGDIKVILANLSGKYKIIDLSDLFPEAPKIKMNQS